jgi:hypothetical protein
VFNLAVVTTGENKMIFYMDPPVRPVEDILAEVSAQTGFSASEIQYLLDCELNIAQLLAYITAVASHRMN